VGRLRADEESVCDTKEEEGKKREGGGAPAAKELLMAELAAMALAATGRYASTR